MKFQARTTALFAVATLSVSLGGCLVEKDKTPPKTYASDTNVLHTYVSGNKITYDLRVVSSAVTNGTLEVEWGPSNLTLIDPLNGSPHTVLKETTSVCYSNTAACDTPDSDEHVVRYIEQETNVLTGKNGTVYLRAVDDPATQDANAGDDWWLSATSLVSPVTLDRFEILSSPFQLGSAGNLEIDFHLRDDCSGGSCPVSLGNFYNNLTAANNLVSVEGTRYGTFTNVYRIDYSGQLTPTDQFLPFFEFLDICRSGNLAGLPINHSGTLYVVPEIGVIKMVNTCQYGTEQSVQYIVTIRNTNITLPPLV